MHNVLSKEAAAKQLNHDRSRGFFRLSERSREARAKARHMLQRFDKDEEGTILIFTIVLFIIMLVIGGMAVDFMRFESRRALLQSVSDRSVLAAASLKQTQDPAGVVQDYFDKAGFGTAIIGTPTVTKVGGSRSVGVEAGLDIPTSYLRFIGIDELAAPAASQAIQGTGNVEISLVLDISGSMEWEPGVRYSDRSGRPGFRRIDLLESAAVSFVDTLLTPDNKDQVSISLVNYSAQVNLGEDLYDALGFAEEIMIDEGDDDDATDDLIHINKAHCVDFPAAQYSQHAFTTAGTTQVETYQSRLNYHSKDGQDTERRTPWLTEPVCPNAEYEGILPLSQDAVELRRRIRALEARQYTSIYLGMKWGMTMLDPSIRDLIKDMPGLDPKFAGLRPANYPADSAQLDTQKYIVLMTDGRNQSGFRVNPTAYDTVVERLRWQNYNVPYWSRHKPVDANGLGVRNYDLKPTRIENPIDEAEGNRLMLAACTAAKAQDITIFSIELGNNTSATSVMAQCASSAGHYFPSKGDDLDDTFKRVAAQITDLRLTL